MQLSTVWKILLIRGGRDLFCLTKGKYCDSLVLGKVNLVSHEKTIICLISDNGIGEENIREAFVSIIICLSVCLGD